MRAESKQFNPVSQSPSPDQLVTEGGLRAPEELGLLGRFWWWFYFLILVKIARLRFLGALFAIGALIVYWDTLKAYYDRWTRPEVNQLATESDHEYFCPMHPTVVRGNQREKCPLCFMPLSKRKKGEGTMSENLPPGTVNRVQLSPYRVVLAGVQTVEIEYRSLLRDITTVGTVEFDERKLSRITARAGGRSRIDKLFLNVTGQLVRKGDPLALLYSPELATTAQNLIDAQQTNNTHLANISADRLRLWGIDDPQIENIRRTGQSITQLTVRSPIAGQVLRKYQVEGEYVEEGARLFDVADLSSVWIEAQVYENQVPFIKQGMKVSATTVGVPGREFQGKVALLQPHFDTASRTLRVRFDIDNASGALRPGMFATVNFQALVHNELSDKETNKVLTVPETAVIDTGNRQIVYRQASVGIFEGVEVKLGPRCGLYYPVYQGLRAGDRVVTAGSFLVDAETRLNPAAGSIYLGRSSGSKGGSSVVAARPSMMADDPVAQTKTSDNKLEKSTLSAEEEADIHKALAKLGSEDQLLAEKQRFCPIVGSRLGSMGTPIKVILQGRPVFLCCSSCRREALADPEGTLRKLEKRKQGHAPELKHDRKDH